MNDENPSFTAIQLENQTLKAQLRIVEHLRLRADEERKRILDQRNTAIKERDRNYAQIEKLTERIKCLQSDHANTLESNSYLREELIQKDKTIKALGEGISNANHTMRNDAITISNLKSELNQLEQDYASMKARFHGANYGVGPDVFAHIILGKTASEDKPKFHCASHGIDPFCHDGMGHPRPRPTWKATFVANNCIKGVVTFEKAPTIPQLNQLQKFFEATSWSVTLP